MACGTAGGGLLTEVSRSFPNLIPDPVARRGGTRDTTRHTRDAGRCGEGEGSLRLPIFMCISLFAFRTGFKTLIDHISITDKGQIRKLIGNRSGGRTLFQIR